MDLLVLYLISINIFSGLFFTIDKIKAINNKFRIPEIFLHFLELCGGVFITIFLMFLIRHKKNKFNFYIISYLILILWIIILIYLK